MTRRRWILGGLLLLLVPLVLVFTVHGARWRAQVALLKLQGELPELSWVELARMLRPGSKYYLERMANSRSGYASVRNPYTKPEDVRAGLEGFAARCSACHGTDGTGGTGANLTGPTLARGNSEWAMYKVIQRGIPGTSMPAHDLGERELWQLVSAVDELRHRFVRVRDSVTPVWAAEPVSAARLLNAAADSGNWLTYHGTFRSWRHSRLRQIDTTNVARLRPVWVYQSRNALDRIEATPLVVGNMMYLTEPDAAVVALDAETGTVRWTFDPELGENLRLCCESVNRGVAILDSTVFVATPDARLFALDCRERAGAVGSPPGGLPPRIFLHLRAAGDRPPGPGRGRGR